ncbi:MAG TPA: 50S ribosomal protein L25/general stress protein Ctc [Rhodanobacteraceae bacterium]|nr:50S ribosomal protein L25/general stress protein Ctc [Rhodanobacteraceae bacterium]
MATTHEIPVQRREDGGKGASRRLRRSGKVPAIVYGARLDPVSVQLEHKDVLLATQHEWFYSSILDLNLDGDRQKVLLRDMQRHPFKMQVLHLDFQRVSENEPIRLRVPLHFLNQEKSPAGKISSVVIMHELTDIEIACLPRDLPEFIEVDLADIDVGDIIHLSELKPPAGVEIPELRLGKEHDIAVVVVREIREEVEEVPAEAEGEAAVAATAAATAAAPGAAPAAAPAAASPARKEDKK